MRYSPGGLRRTRSFQYCNIEMKSSSPRLTFITGINEQYFLLCGMLIESLDRHFPLIPLHVMDFGLSEAQREFFRAKDMLLPMPKGLTPQDHPYKLKGAMREYLGDRFDAPIWIDADMMALRNGTEELLARWEQMMTEGKRVAVTTCHGPPGGIAETLGSVTSAQPMPHLSAHIAGSAERMQRLYVNAALIFFGNGEVISDWRAKTDAFEGDACWEQNALNAILGDRLEDALILDARIWNVHSALIDEMSGDKSDLRCGGRPAILAHATSAIIGHMQQEGASEMNFSGYTYRNFLRFFSHAPLRELQNEYLTAFIGEHFDLLTRLGIFTRA